MANFNEAVSNTIVNEGGYVNDPDDKGAATKFGISKRSYPDLNIKGLTLDDAVVIYKKDFWDKIQGDKINDQHIANKFFDIAVNIGLKNAIKKMQLALNSQLNIALIVDGIFGIMSLNAMNCLVDLQAIHAVELKFLELVEKYYRSLPNANKYLKGWLKRLYS